ncbi:serine carboxypeptidase-like 18 isoform X2 [Cornus florida]|uniref:serine carboxypeptidase-like 18 isoform X2 n=1 Tax=Cornus florida TaxID=4283 RepID=UPI00289C48D2|nr:serine carboxypeptidase-like 18 isoform X2 [Cornus florida]
MARKAATLAVAELHYCQIALCNSNCFNNISIMCLLPLFLFAFSGIGIATSRTIITSIPGFNGTLPFTLETGYVGVGELDDVQLFYYFVESQRNPEQDPLLLWLTGGPGCSTLSAFFYESGPVIFNTDGYKGGLPTLSLNDYAWTQRLNIIYLDAPVGSGFSYSTSQQGYYIDDYKSSAQTYQFLRKWLIDHPQFLENNLYIGGDSYSGIPVPMLVQEIISGNGAEKEPFMNLQGYVLGNPVTDSYIDDNSRIPFAHRLTLISDDLYQSAKTSCNGDYVNVVNEQCESAIEAIDEVLDPYCGEASARPHELSWRRRSLKEHSKSSLLWQPNDSAYYCHDYVYVLCAVWANDKGVRKALHVREGTKGVWERCNGSLAYTKDVTSSVAYHQNLTSAALRALIYSGDHDMSVPHIGTQEWIGSLNLTVGSVWRAWFVDGQVAGYVKKLTENNFALTYATVKGAGHVAPEYKPKECYTMLDRWFAYYPL